MQGKLNLDSGIVASCHDAARSIASSVDASVTRKSTVSVERAITRLLGVDGATEAEVPLPNVLVDRLDPRQLERGISFWLGNAVLVTGRSPQQIAEEVAAGNVSLASLPVGDEARIRTCVLELAERQWRSLLKKRAEREKRRASMEETAGARAYVLTATGNVYEDARHARAVADHGGDIVAVIRSTAQSLLDYVPYGATTEGFGGTFATQENFRIMRAELDAWSQANGRYVQLSSFCSGLCMPEIAAAGALEGLDNMVNDALYGVLYRDINMIRTLIDQRVSRMINGAVGTVINTGEDNYLRTADALAAAPSVVASQLINYYLARASQVPDHLIAIGNSFEIDPNTENGLLYEWAQAQLTRELFPDCPVKYMPPTKHMNGNLFRTHACDTLFNLVTVATGQAIQTIGVPTEAIFTPHIQDRVLGLQSVKYVANFARGLDEEIQFRPGGVVQSRARQVLATAHDLLHQIGEIGLFGAIEAGMFGDVSRPRNGGKGADGIIELAGSYLNPFEELITGGLRA